jgi:hypothetical protein
MAPRLEEAHAKNFMTAIGEIAVAHQYILSYLP